MTRTATVVALLLMAAGCEPGHQAAEAIRSDSAGVLIVENTEEGLAAAPEWTVSAEPVLEIGGEGEGELTPYEVRDVRPLRDGRFAIANSGSGEVWVVDRNGELALTLGRLGDGPGEFRDVQSVLSIAPDSVGVYDARQRRLSVFDASGQFARSLDLGEHASPGAWSQVLPLTGREIVFFNHGGFGAEPRDAPWRAETTSYRLSLDGEVLGQLGTFPGPELFATNGMMGSVLYGPSTAVATMGGELIVGIGETPQVEIHDATGLRRIVRWPDHERDVTEERVTAFIETALREAPEAQRTAMRAQMLQVPTAEKMPPYGDLLVSQTSELWVGDYLGPEVTNAGLPSPRRRWLVFDSTGAVAAVAWTPEGFQPRAVAADGLVYGVATDSLGVETVRVYRLSKNQGWPAAHKGLL